MGTRNVPAQLTSFIGRDRELSELIGLASRTRLLTLTGPGGTGKTRLAIALCDAVAESSRTDAWFVDLAPVTDAALVDRAVANALDVHTTDVDARTALLDVLRDSDRMIVLDNCEHVLGAATALAGSLLGGCGNIRVIATSREPLGLGPETVWLVPAMATPVGDENIAELASFDAVRLVVDRASVVNRTFELTDANADGIVRVIKRLDGIPLALELAAAWSRTLTPSQIAERLDDRFRLLTRGSADAPPRHQTLRAAIDWSYELLDADHREIFARLAVFRGGFTLEAAEHVCADDEGQRSAVLEAVAGLVEASLLVADTSREAARYSTLETIREYAAEILASDPRSAAYRRRHLAWFTELADRADGELRGAHQGLWLAVLEDEHDNVREALRWSLESADELGLRLAGFMGQFWRVRAHLREGRSWLERWLATTSDAPSVDRGRALNVLGMLTNVAGDTDAARAAYEASEAVMRAIGDLRGVASALANLGVLAVSIADWSEARAKLEEALRIFTQIGDTTFEARMRLNLGAVLTELGELEDARSALESAMNLLQEQNDRSAIAGCAGELGNLLEREEDWAGAAKRYEEALAIFRELGMRDREANALRSLAGVAVHRGEPDTAISLLEDALRIYQETGVEQAAAIVLLHLGRLDLEVGGDDRAAVHLREALGAARAPRFVVVESLEAFAALAQRHGDGELSAFLLGAASIIRDTERREPSDDIAATLLEATSEGACSSVGRTTFERETTRGRIATYEDVIAEAVAFTERAPWRAAAGAPLRMTLEGEVWIVLFEGRTVRLYDSKGMQHLAALVAVPGREIHVLDLVAGAADPRTIVAPRAEPGAAAARGGDAGDVLDIEARAAYERRLVELQEEIDEAEGFSDEARATRLRAEFEMIVDELRRATGLGGRDRKAASETERARLNVQRTIRAAIKRLFEADQALGRHLDDTIKTGTYCSYAP